MPVGNKVSDWLIFVQGPIRGFVYKPACEFQYELLNFTMKFRTKFATFTEKLCEINCNVSQALSACLFLSIGLFVKGEKLVPQPQSIIIEYYSVTTTRDKT
jgi:hypothetical protein